MFPIVLGHIDEKDPGDEHVLTDLQCRKPQLYRLWRILDSAMGIYSLPIQVVESILLPYLRIIPKNPQGFPRMELSKKNVDLGLWIPSARG